MTDKSFFILRYKHFPPEGPIKLGQIISNPAEPYDAIDTSGPTPFPSDMPLVQTTEEDFSWDTTAENEGHGSVSAQMDALPVSGSVSAEFKRTHHDWAAFESLETTLIVPSMQYVKDSMLRPSVREFLGKSILPKRVFMVTGMKVARRASGGHERSRSHGGSLQVGITPTPVVPISVGPDIGGSNSITEKVSSKAQDFVWAFSLKQIHYRRGKFTQSSTYSDGATLEDRIDEYGDEVSDDEENEEVDASKLDIEVDGLDSSNFTGEGSQLVSVSEITKVQDGQEFLTIANM
jgi:hypothetical protein